MPWWLVLFASASAAYLVLPLVFMGSRVPWDQFPAVLSSDEAADALSLSLKTCAAALAIDLVLGVPLAVALSRDWRGVGVLRVLVALPLALPPVVAGIALVAAFGRRGVLGSQLEAFGVTVAFTTAAVVLAQVFVSLPFLVVTVEAALRSRPRGLEETAASLGARPTRVLASVTLPMVVPGVARGAALALARCLGEFGATLTFAGSLQGITRTLPIQVYLARESADKTDLVLGIILVGVAALVVAATEMPARGRRRVREEEGLDDGGGPDAVDAPQSVQHVEEKAAVPLRVEGKVVERGWDVSIEVGAGEVLAVMGHNGAGKSTLAEVLSGSLALDSGTVQIGNLTADAAGAFIPPRGRGVAMVSQNPRIFEHMTVLANVAFPLVCRGFPRAQARRLARGQLRKVGCERLAARRGGQLSGGQAARVALARALVFSPRLLILDEPTAALDVEASSRVGAILVDRLKSDGTTTVLVTHDVAEAVELGTRMIVLERGRVVEDGSPAEVLARPVSAFGASLAGLNAVAGVLRIDGDGLPSIDVGGGQELTAAEASGIAAGQPVTFMFAPEAVALSSGKVVGSARSSLPATVERVSTAGGLVTVRLRFPNRTPFNARITPAALAELALAPGDEAVATVKATQVRAVGAGRSVSTAARGRPAEADTLT
ncbi:molybdenum ABC transporter [Peptidiphaga gingivicola]|uniref:Molybdenum ABC transporter n=1 Tax=Peptidiphaga gingivicola TaxID=2741497 RepID=A0A179B7W3_9ACTO|nr:molybdenum ABC transporter [Peptidiphaga gingivicola]